MKHLYELTKEMEDLMDSEDCTDLALQEVFGDIQVKAGNICQFIRVMQSNAEAFKAEETRLSSHRKTMENKITSIKEYLKGNMQRLGIEKLDAGVFKIALQNSPPSMVVEDGADIPADCKIFIPAHEEVDKGKLKDKLKAGEVIEGAYLVQDQHIRIR